MEELAKNIIEKIDKICIDFYYFRKENTINFETEFLPSVQSMYERINWLATENPNDKDIIDLKNYAVDVINDLVTSIEINDQVLLVDTLDFGVRELMNIFIEDGKNVYE